MKTIIASVLALLITLATAYYQRVSGPSYPKKVFAEVNGKHFNFKLPRSHESTGDCEVRIPIHGNDLAGRIYYKRYPTNEAWDTIKMIRAGDDLVGMLPAQPPAGKLVYYVELIDGNASHMLDHDAAIIRFRGEVPGLIMVPHIIFMFLAMLFSNLAGFQAAFGVSRMRVYMFMTVILMFIGGFIFGPIMQKYAFGEFWTGFPYGWDLTDNKTLIAFLVWIIAMLLNLRKARPAWIIVAAVITLVVYCIPHSMFGSELNYASGTVTTG
jgi:hypothetical protein